jgi:hypothetical protein
MIQILKILEKVYPSKIKTENLAKNLKLQLSDKEFKKIIQYLASTSKIQIETYQIVPGTLLSPNYGDSITLSHFGINLLTELELSETKANLTKQQNKFTEIMVLATIIMGIAAFFELSKFEPIIKENSDLGLLLTIILTIIILTSITFLVIDFAIYSSKKYLLKNP